jgi:mannose-6-phosphate isomerase
LSANRLPGRRVGAVWGRRHLPGPFALDATADEPIGEIWFEDPRGSAAPLLVKALFTSQKLSIQVHPGVEAARARGLPRGKDEALDGSIEALIDWRPAKAGDVFYSPAGTIHAIGAGLSLIEVQQNLDLTYRLYDYGRPRPLQLDDALAVADPGPWTSPFAPVRLDATRQILAAGGAFVVERWTGSGPAAIEAGDQNMLIVPIASGGALDGQALAAGSAWSVRGRSTIGADSGLDVLVAYPGGRVNERALIPV